MKTKKYLLPVAVMAALLIFSTACTSKKIQKTVASADGSLISYETQGQGDAALVFVHCWACNQNYWRNQVGPFSKDFRVVTLDMAGHGRSKDFKRQEWSVSKMAEDVEAVIRDLDLKNVVLVGSSMGGPISLEVASKMTDRVRGVACVDTLHDAEKPMPREMFEQITTKLKTDFQKGVKEFMPFMFTDKPDPKLLEWTANEAATCDPKACVPLMQSFADMDLKALMKKAQVPIRCVNAAPYRPDGFKTSVATNRKYADFDAVEMTGVGHFPMLERPEEFNAKLRDAVRSILTAKPSKSAPPN